MTIAPTIGVFALQGDVREHVRALEAVGAKAVAVRRPAELEAVDGLIIPGGESTTMWKLAETFELLEPLRMRIKSGMPAYGSCAGMIMLADRIEGGIEGQQTIGGIDMVVRRNAFGRQVDSFEADIDFAGRGEMRAIFIRAPWVESMGSDVEVLARAEPGDRIVAVRQGPLLATSFHPELTGDVGVHSYFAEMVREF
ncbi:pyridoxal 5'-phosphate synthase glutaminase subunit PdxT [Streptosporangium subroseum]|uniref:Pyridoxal 5'-phosphate synthase subunit PdxT n=1 Tax=Streptosporangium subroseum TaxID=106412 RepID=A0A239M3K0_9ACTN|nr:MULTISPECIES: pyridoxal 5'-phosphate synthase glutaminase subunit PdxT [Streptosporangium]AWS42340.1 pyridoxal 5'-phosphate synthase glutaminase subunit PdxT [Streptosporangium sp. 'caverna']WSA14131.1 pyridoxal 5'-phosphate synthase glutaminase subunit PdxT [Streptosporangium subroseum]SNT37236.1 5'-phosphate synthase pdxT subunit [Streptosporangium subroseum]